MSDPITLVTVPDHFIGRDVDVIVEVPLTDWNDNPFTLQVTVTTEGIITDVLTADGEVIATEGEMFADIAFRLSDQG